MVDLLLVLNLESIGGQDHLNVVCDFLPRTLIEALEDPDHFEDRDQADEPRFLFGEPVGDDLGRAGRLHRIVLRQIAQKDIGIDSYHFFRLNLCVAPPSMPPSISSSAPPIPPFPL